MPPFSSVSWTVMVALATECVTKAIELGCWTELDDLDPGVQIRGVAPEGEAMSRSFLSSSGARPRRLRRASAESHGRAPAQARIDPATVIRGRSLVISRAASGLDGPGQSPEVVLTVILAMPTRRPGLTASVLDLSLSSSAATGEISTFVPSCVAVSPPAFLRLQCAAVQLEEEGACDRGLAVHGDVAVDAGDAGVDIEVGQFDLGATGAEGETGAFVLDLADDVRRNRAGPEHGHVATGDQKHQRALGHSTRVT